MTRLTEVSFGEARPVDGYGPGHWRIGGEVIRGAAIAWAKGAREWGGYADPAPLLVFAGEVDVLFVGTGRRIAHLPQGFRAALEAAGIAVEAMDSPAAARTYNVLLSEGRRVAVALLAVGESA
ncbi:MAG: Mth938-like domain-containing protein [Paracoccaceae bacterium]